MNRLCVLYDASCAFCARCRAWLEQQEAYIPLLFVPRDGPEAARLFPTLDRSRGAEELTVIGDDGGVYRGPDAFILCLYALEEYREWSLRLASPPLRPLARMALALLSSGRHRISAWLGACSDEELARRLEAAEGDRARSYLPRPAAAAGRGDAGPGAPRAVLLAPPPRR